MIQKMSLIAALTFVFVFAQTASTDTAGMLNGRGWIVLDQHFKAMYMKGMQDEWMFSSVFGLSNMEKASDDKWAAGFVVGDYIRELDLLYRDGENLHIPIPFAVVHLTAKLKGNLTKEELEQRLIKLRKAVSVLK